MTKPLRDSACPVRDYQVPFDKVRIKRDLGSTATGVKKRARLIRPWGAASVIAETSVGVFGLHRAGHNAPSGCPFRRARMHGTY